MPVNFPLSLRVVTPSESVEPEAVALTSPSVRGDREKTNRSKVLNVQVSNGSFKKATLLERFISYSGENRSWGKDQKLLRYNILQVQNTKNYRVLLAMGRRKD